MKSTYCRLFILLISFAAFGLIATSGNRKATNLAGVMTSGIAVATAVSHLKDLGKKHNSGIREL